METFQIKMTTLSPLVAIMPQEKVDSPIAHQPPEDYNNVAGPSVNPSTSHDDDNHPVV